MFYQFLLGFIIGIILIYILVEFKNNCFIRSTSLDTLNNIIKILVRQSARWANAALQDENVIIGLLHANYAVSYLCAIKHIVTDQQVKIATGIDMQKFTQEIVKIQDQSTKKMIQLCPQFITKNNYLATIAGEGQ